VFSRRKYGTADWLYRAFVVDEWTSSELWWNNTDGESPQNSEKSLFQFHFVHHKSHMEWPRIEPRRSKSHVADQRPDTWHGHDDGVFSKIKIRRFWKMSAPSRQTPSMYREMKGTLCLAIYRWILRFSFNKIKKILVLCHRLTSDPRWRFLSLSARRVCFDTKSQHPQTGKSSTNSKTNTKAWSQNFVTDSGTECKVLAAKTRKSYSGSSETVQIPVAARSKAWICGRSLSGIAGSKPVGVMDVCLLWVLCVVR
jgi:hypothetical protein